MTRSPITYTLLFCVSSHVHAQPASPIDLSELIFSPVPISYDDSVGAIDAVVDPEVGPVTDEESRERLLGSLDEIQSAIFEEESANGLQSTNLVEHLTALATIYQEMEEHDLALIALERARRIGDSSNQALIVSLMIDSMEAVGRFAESDALQDSLLHLARQAEGDPRVPFILASVADRQMEVVDAYLDKGVWTRSRQPFRATEGSGWDPSRPGAEHDRAAGTLTIIANAYDAAIERVLTSDDYQIGDPLRLETELGEVYRIIDLANDFGEQGFPPPAWEPDRVKSDRDRAIATFNRARRLYSAAMQAALGQGNHNEYLKFEKRFVEMYAFERAHPALHGPPCYGPDCPEPTSPQVRERPVPDRARTLTSVLRARVVDRLSRGRSVVDVVVSLVELADTYSNRATLEWYQLAHDFLVRQNAPAGTIASIFSPETPAIRPASTPADFVEFDPARSYLGYIDVSIEIGRYGETKGTDILGASPEISRKVERLLRSHVSQTRFRPRFVDGEPAPSANMRETPASSKLMSMGRGGYDG